MGRSNYAILAMGLAAMLVMSLLMKQFLHKADEKRTGPLVHELSATFGGRLDRESQVVLVKDGKEDAPQGATPAMRARVTIYPMMGTSVRKLAQEIGEYVWRRIGNEKNLQGVVVICHSLSVKQPREFDVARPYMSSGKKVAPKASAGKGTKKTTPAKPQAPTPGRDAR